MNFEDEFLEIIEAHASQLEENEDYTPTEARAAARKALKKSSAYFDEEDLFDDYY